MKIISARIRNYRTVQDETHLAIERGLTLVGPNNAGKTNLLKAVRLFFTGYGNVLGYAREHDLSFGQSSQKTNIALTFRIEAEDGPDIGQAINQITELLELQPPTNNEFTVYLTFSVASNPTYRVYPNSRRPESAAGKAAYSRLERSLVDMIFNKFSIHYIPSDKSTEQLYNDLVLPFLLRKAYQALSPHMGLIRAAMNDASKSLNASLKSAGIENVESTFEFPQDPKRFFKDVDFSLSDPTSTSIFNKGMGIQSAALLAAFNWITQEEINDGKNVLWLLEEPESYLHPELATQCDRLIDELRERAQVVCTTHALGFVPQDPQRTLGVSREAGWTKTQEFKTYHEATNRIRRSLGVRFSDFYNLDHFNVLVEGETDREYFQAFASLFRSHDSTRDVLPISTSRAISFLDHGGVSGLEGFVRATFQFIYEERPCIVVVDGDTAGDRCRRNLQSFLGNKKIPFQANRQFIVVRDRHAVEGLFPDDWIKELYAQHPNWFEDYSVDASNSLMPFNVADSHKRQFMNAMMSRASAESDIGWATRWLQFFITLEEALKVEGIRVYGSEAEMLKTLSYATASLGSATLTVEQIVDSVGDVDFEAELGEGL